MFGKLVWQRKFFNWTDTLVHVADELKYLLRIHRDRITAFATFVC